MTRDQIEAVRQEAQRVLDRCSDASNALVWQKFDNKHGGYWSNENTRATAALKRASMDLTRALADLRRPA